MSLVNKIIGKLNLSPTKEKVVRNVVWAVTGKVVTLLGGLLVGIFVARYLGPEQYGLMSYVMSYVAIFQVLASFGMDQIEIREEAKYPEEKDKIIGTALVLKIGFAIVTIGLVCLTVWLFEADHFTKWMIMLYSLSMIMNSFGVIRNYFTSIVWNEYIVKTEITRTFIGAGIKIGLLLLHAPLVWFISATLLDTILKIPFLRTIPPPAPFPPACTTPASTRAPWSRCMWPARPGKRICSARCCNGSARKSAGWCWKRSAKPAGKT